VTFPRSAVPLLLLPLLSACGGSSGSPSAPDAPDPSLATAVVAVDGWTGHPIAAAVSPGTASQGTVVTAAAPGYLTREQRFDGRPVALWPATESYVRELVYGWEFTDSAPRLVRWDAGFVVTLEGDLAADVEVAARVDGVLHEIRRTTGIPVTLGPGGAVVVAVDPGGIQPGALADTQIAVRGGSIASARVRLPSRAELLGGRGARWGNTLLHELGHAVGLSHSGDDRDVMTPGAGRGRQVSTFTQNEAVALRLMYMHRRPGNLLVDRDPALVAASARTEVLTVVD
jgi:hypothetical protein